MSRKKEIVFLLSLFLSVFLLFGCAKKVKQEVVVEKEPPVVEKVVKEEPVKPPEPPKPPEPVVEKIPDLQMIHFEFDKYRLIPEAIEVLNQNGKVLSQHSNLRVRIEGHCDERGTVEYNLALGEKRANSSKEFLVKYGISEDRLSTISYGKERPLINRSDEEAWAMNRRAVFVTQ